MSIKLQVGDTIYNYPETGSINYGEGATEWARAVTEVLQEVFGPGDIQTTETELVGASGNVSGLIFDTSFVQRIFVEGQIKREFSSNPTRTESFTMEGIFNGTTFSVAVTLVGEDNTGVLLDISNSGQVTFESETIVDTTAVTIKYKAKAIIDEEVLGL